MARSHPKENPKSPALAGLQWLIPHLQNDANAFIPFVFNTLSYQTFRQSPLHRELQQFLTDHPRALIELPRDHGKTTQICGRILWELGRDPALRVKIVCATDLVASERVRFLRDAITRNLRLRLVFPHLTPAVPWLAESFTIARPRETIGPSVTAFGVGSGSTGTRADLLVCDDIVDARSIMSRADRDRVRTHFENNLMNLLEPKGRFWGLCTPWHEDDLNARLKKNPAFVVMRRGINADFDPIWAEVWPRERLIARHAEIGEAAFSRGYRLIAVNDAERIIQPEWVRFWTERPTEFDRVLLAIDPAIETHAKADFTAIVALGLSGQTVYCLEATAKRVKAHQLVEWIAQMDSAWHPDVIVVESNGAFQIQTEMLLRQPGFGSRIRPEKAKVNKVDRIRAFSVLVQQGFFFVNERTQQALLHEMTTFPFCEHDDLVDAAAMGMTELHRHGNPRAIVT